VGTDVSPSSLEAEHQLAEQHDLDNLELVELPIEQVASLDREFDLVVCTGVLHHLADPVVGLRALRAVLAPTGALHLMVYATYGRTGISMVRDLASLVGVDADDVDSLVELLREVPQGHPISHLLREARDFGDRDALTDALLNPRERSYTVPEVFDLLQGGGARFSRWVRQAPYRPQVGIMRELTLGSRIAALDEIDQYAVMELFRGTINRHSLIAYRDDSHLPDPPVDWVGGWGRHVPMIPGTVIVVQENLPPGMAAAVINRAHTDRDLVCFLDAGELAVFSAIDGTTATHAIPGASRELFERLWLHDLVIVDASQDAGGSHPDARVHQVA
jgi:SAM-dependent methyltransferase